MSRHTKSAAVLMAMAFVALGCQPPGAGSGLLGPGQLAPQLAGEGWLNGSEGAGDLSGKVTVVEVFAYW